MKICFATKEAIETNFQDAQFRRFHLNEFDGWFIYNLGENILHYSILDGNIPEIPGEEIAKIIPQFPEIQSAPLGAIFNYNPQLEKLIEVDTAPKKNVSNQALASNQAQLTVDFKQWRKHEIQPMSLYRTGIIICVLALPFYQIIPILLIGFLVYKIQKYKERIIDYFQVGNTCPGIVVGINPTLIATRTDLSKMIGNYPVIQVCEYNLKTNLGKPIKIGDRIPLVSLYALVNETLPHWDFFFSFPVEYATKDLNIIRERIRSISEESWLKTEDAAKNADYELLEDFQKIYTGDSSWKTLESL